MSSHALTASDVRMMLELGVNPSNVAERLVESGAWSKSGANEIVRFMTRGPDPLMRVSMPLPRPNPKREPDPRGAGLRRGSWA